MSRLKNEFPKYARSLQRLQDTFELIEFYVNEQGYDLEDMGRKYGWNIDDSIAELKEQLGIKPDES
jgi:hypothetical protein